MSTRIFAICARTIPAAWRQSHGAALTDLATEMVESKNSSAPREALGIVLYGLRKRTPKSIRRIAELPWAESLWLLAAPVASIQFAVLLLAQRSGLLLNTQGDYGFQLGMWWTAMLAASGLALIAAVRRDRLILGLGGIAVLVLALFDTYGPGGSMLGGTSHGVDLGSSSGILSPAVLFLLPTTLLPIAAAFVRPTQMPSTSAPARALGRLAIAAPPLIALALTYGRIVGTGEPPRSILWLSVGEPGYLAVLTVIFGSSLLLALLCRSVRHPASALAAALLIATQIPALALVTTFLVVDGFGPDVATLAVTVLLYASSVVAIVRLRFGPIANWSRI